MDNVPDIDRLLLCRTASDTMGAVADADNQIVEAMVATYRAGIYRLACSILQDPDEAEDAVQHTFLSAALSLSRYRPGSNFKAWLFTIAVNVCRGMLRRRKTRQSLARLLGLAYRQIGYPDSPEEALAQGEAAQQLWSAVERLDEKHRLVVVLRYGQELTITEIAQILSLHEKTVYSRLYEAFRQLRGQLTMESENSWQAERVRKEVAP